MDVADMNNKLCNSNVKRETNDIRRMVMRNILKHMQKKVDHLYKIFFRIIITITMLLLSSPRETHLTNCQ